MSDDFGVSAEALLVAMEDGSVSMTDLQAVNVGKRPDGWIRDTVYKMVELGLVSRQYSKSAQRYSLTDLGNAALTDGIEATLGLKSEDIVDAADQNSGGSDLDAGSSVPTDVNGEAGVPG